MKRGVNGKVKTVHLVGSDAAPLLGTSDAVSGVCFADADPSVGSRLCLAVLYCPLYMT